MAFDRRNGSPDVGADHLPGDTALPYAAVL